MAFPKKTQGDLVASPMKESAPAFPGGLEISLKHWHGDWMKLEELGRSALEKFQQAIRLIQRQGILGNPGVDAKRVKTPASLKPGVTFSLDGHLYEIKVSGKARVFIGTDEKENPSLGYLMYVDPSHEIAKSTGKRY